MDHHYVPQFYLRQWAGADGRVWRYRREPSGAISERAVVPRGTAFEPDLYAAPDVGGLSDHDPHIIETKFFGKIDNAAALVLPKLLGPQPVRLTDDERTAWALLMNSLFERTPTKLGPRDAAAPALAGQVNEHVRARYALPEDRACIDEVLAGLDTVQMARNSIREFMVKEIRNPKAIGSLTGLTWLVAQRDAAAPLLTTDRPARMSEPFIDLLTMPLSPTKLLLAYRSEVPFDENLRGTLASILMAHDLVVLPGARCIYSMRRIEGDLRAVVDRALLGTVTEPLRVTQAASEPRG